MFKIYLQNFSVIEQDFQIDAHIYLNTDPEKCMERVEKRSRDGETIPIEYLEKCKLYHDKWFKCEDNVLTVNTSDEFETNKEIFTDIVEKIKEFI